MIKDDLKLKLKHAHLPKCSKKLWNQNKTVTINLEEGKLMEKRLTDSACISFYTLYLCLVTTELVNEVNFPNEATNIKGNKNTKNALIVYKVMSLNWPLGRKA